MTQILELSDMDFKVTIYSYFKKTDDKMQDFTR